MIACKYRVDIMKNKMTYNEREIAKSPRQLKRGELHSERIPEKYTEFPLSNNQKLPVVVKITSQRIRGTAFSIPGNRNRSQ